MDEYFDRQNENGSEERTENAYTEAEETVTEKDSAENEFKTETGIDDAGYEEAVESHETATGMTDEEIRRAAENIGSPYTSYEYSSANSADGSASNGYSSYSYGNTGHSYSESTSNNVNNADSGKN